MYIYTRVFLYEFLETFLWLRFDTLAPWIYTYLAVNRKIYHFSQGRLKISLRLSPASRSLSLPSPEHIVST